MNVCTENSKVCSPFLELKPFLELELPKKEIILSPWLLKQSASMIFAKRGLGKSFFTMSLSLAVISGNSFLGWPVLSPQGVLYVDGEMGANLLQERLTSLTGDKSKLLHPFYIANYQLLGPESGLLNLTNRGNQKRFMDLIPADCNLIIFDNISCIFGGMDENDAHEWHHVQDWINQLRSLGYTVILIHHAGKNEQQRGTSKREDNLDLVIKLSEINLPNTKGANFRIDFLKARSLTSDETTSMIASLSPTTSQWTHMSVDEAENKKILELHSQGLTQADIALELKISQSTVSRRCNMLRSKGLIAYG